MRAKVIGNRDSFKWVAILRSGGLRSAPYTNNKPNPLMGALRIGGDAALETIGAPQKEPGYNPAMPTAAAWSSALQQSPDPKRAQALFDQLRHTDAGSLLTQASPEQARILAMLLSGSQVLGELLLAHPDWIPTCLDPAGLHQPKYLRQLRRELRAELAAPCTAEDSTDPLARLRRFKQRQMLRLATRDLAGLVALPELLREISDLADLCIETVLSSIGTQFTTRLGQPYHANPDGTWQPTAFCVFGMGKLGGHELNYSSDVDLLFVYSDEGWVFKEPPKRNAPGRGLSNHQFYQRLIETLVAELTRLTADGFLYRVDLRLRPEGDAGPLARSLNSYENYYAQWGQTWERMMLIKARCVAGDPSLAAEFLEMIQPFRYPRSLPEHVLPEIAAIKQRIESEVVRSGELDRNVKLGRGGIREIEFITQSLQLIQGGRIPFLQNPQTLIALEKLVQYDLLTRGDAQALATAYAFLRNVEHRLQMEANQQTHTVPTAPTALDRLARLMGCPAVTDFQSLLQSHTQRVRDLYQAVIQTKVPEPGLPLPESFTGHESAWQHLLASHSFTRPDHSFTVLRTFIEGPGYGHMSPRTIQLARQLTHQLLLHCPRHDPDQTVHWPTHPLSDPDRVLVRLDSYVTAYGSRSMLYETWTSNPSIFQLLLLLFDRSEFLAETAIRTPDLVEDLMLSGQLRRRKTAAQILDELRHGARDPDQQTWLRQYHQAEFMRLGLRDILGLVDFELNLAELSGLADACLQYALEAVMRRHRLKHPPFAIVGLGKLGGAELTYGSDLDIAFVTDSRARNTATLQKLAAEVMELLSAPTEYGVVFPTDARLRPDGAKGRLVNSLKTCEQYYRQRAMLWELQAISRSRAVAGNLTVGQQFCRLAAELSDFSRPRPDLHAYRPDWLDEIHRMRQRIEKERTPPGKDALAIKTGRGGLVDAEFIAQALCMQQGWAEPNTLRALERARDSCALPADAADPLIHHYRRLLHIEGILRRWSFVGEALLPDDPAPLYRVAVRCGYPDAKQFLAAVSEHRNALRNAYARAIANS
jgi:[glutamine synthetase] adenylyltransferase / [glutamine synthetase]-adenylyl-L-tyrosine phosphorylase